MFIKQFRHRQVRVPDPLRPSKRVFEDRLIPAGGGSIEHEGVKYEADEDGWVDVPQDLGVHLRSFRAPGGERWYAPEEVDEQVRLGIVDADPADALPKPRTKATAKAAE